MTKLVDYPGEGWKSVRLQEALKGGDPLLRMGAIRVLQNTPMDDCIPPLAEALDDGDRLVRMNAAIALGRAKAAAAVPALVRHAAADPDGDVCSYAEWAYRQVDYALASPLLVDVLLGSEDPRVVRFAAGEIRQKSDAKAIDALVQRFGSRGMYTGYDLDMAAIRGLCEIGYATVEPLVKCLDSDDTRVRANAVYALGRIGDERAIQPLVNHLPKAGLELRSRIGDALVRIGRASIPALVTLLASDDGEIKWIAAYGLGRIGPEAEPALLKALGLRGPHAGEEIIYALGMAGRKNAFLPLYEVYTTTADDSVRAWSAIALAGVIAACHGDVPDRAAAGKFLDELGDRMKPHMLLSSEALHALGKVYVERAASPDAGVLKANIATGVKCFDLSILEKDNAPARAFRLFYGSYLKLMTSKSPEIMSYIERDVQDMKKEAERSGNKKEIILLMDGLLKVLQGAYEDRGFDFSGHFGEYSGLCKRMEPFLDDFYRAEDPKKLSLKEESGLHGDIGVAQGKIDALLRAYQKRGDAESVALAYRLSTELARLDTGIYDDYQVVEACLRNLVARSVMADQEKSDLHFKILLVGKTGISQVQLVLDGMLKGENAAPAARKPAAQKQPAAAKAGRKAGGPGRLEYLAVAIIVILAIVVIVLALNKFGIVPLPFRLPIAWLNP